MALIVSLVLSFRISSAEEFSDEWPALRLGVWEIVSKRALPSGKTETLKYRRKICNHPRSMFFGYWGFKQVGIGGCAFESKKLSNDSYRLRTRCDVKGGGTSEGILTVKSEDSYELTMTTKEGKRVTQGSKTGHRVGDCARGLAKGGPDLQSATTVIAQKKLSTMLICTEFQSSPGTRIQVLTPSRPKAKWSEWPHSRPMAADRTG